jgi:dTDP-glucose pyrophosphorylase
LKNISLVIPAAGEGRRFKEAGFLDPKPLIPVKGAPMIVWVMNNFNLNQQDEIIIIQQANDNLIDKLNPYLSKIKAKVKFATVNELTDGPAKTVMAASSHISKENALIVANSDQFVSKGIEDFVYKTRILNNSGLILTMTATGRKWSYVKRNKNGNISEVKEKVEISNEATVGIYSWSSYQLMHEGLSDMFSHKDLTNGEFYVAPSYNYLIDRGVIVSPQFIGDHASNVHGLGTPEDLSNFEQTEIQFMFND